MQDLLGENWSGGVAALVGLVLLFLAFKVVKFIIKVVLLLVAAGLIWVAVRSFLYGA